MPTFKSMPRAKTGRNASNNTEQVSLSKQPAKRFSFKRILMLLLLIVIVMLMSIGTTIYFTWPASAEFMGLGINSQKNVIEPIEKEARSVPIPSEKPLFFTLEPFTATITDGSRSRIIHVAITPQVADEASLKLLENYKPLVRDRILRILSEQNSVHVQTPEGRQQLVDSLLNSLSQSYDNSPLTTPRIQDLFFTAFVIQ